mmetsp:Transcript_12007/g.15663  ORF Transcript_12007/g.15663 Transcript_12007/m.15663 type:complete len:246 (+) Transcript_12007:94-831(+)
MLPNFQHLVIGTLNTTISGIVKHQAACNCASAHLDKVSNDGKIRVVTEGNNLLVDHKSKDTHHSGTAVVELDGTLGELGLLIKVIPSEVNVSVTEVTNVLVSSSRNITHEGALQPSDEGKDLDKSSSGDGVRSEEGGNTVGEGVEGVSGVVDGSRKVESSAGDNLSKEGKLSDTAVLDLDVSEAVESLLVSLIEESEGVEEANRGLDTELTLESVKSSGGLAGLDRGEGSGGGGKGGEDGKLHHG